MFIRKGGNMKKKNVMYMVIFATVFSLIVLPAIAGAGEFDFFKMPTIKRPEPKVVQPKPKIPFLSQKLVIGFEETYMGERNFKHPDFSEGDIRFESVQHLGTLSYKLLDGITLKGKVGTAELKNDTWGYGRHDYELAWGAGGEWNLFKFLNKCFSKIPPTLPGGINLIVGGEYFTIGVDKNTDSVGNSLEEEWREWSGAVVLSRNWGAFTPYIGARLSDAEVKTKLESLVSHHKSNNNNWLQESLFCS